MKNQNKTISIGISVYNEAATIENLIISIIRQDKSNYNLEKIYVICDGTNDGTEKIVENLKQKYSLICLVNDGKRVGKIERLKEIFKLNTSDIIMVLDGDVVLGNVDVLNEVVKCFEKTETTLVSANNQPIKGESFYGKVINYGVYIWYLARIRFNNGDNVHNVRGCCIALKKEFSKRVKFPSKIHSYGRYLYLLSQKEKQKFNFARKAIILYRKPNNIQDYILQTNRTKSDRGELEQLFGNRMTQIFRIPIKYKFLAVINSFIHHPILFICSIMLKIVTKKFSYKIVNSKNAVVWETVASTKKTIPIPF